MSGVEKDRSLQYIYESYIFNLIKEKEEGLQAIGGKHLLEFEGSTV